MGVSFVRMGVDGIPNTLDIFQNGQLNYDLITEFSAVDYSFMFSYAQKALKNGLSFGGSAKIIRRKAGEFAGAWGFGIDAGMQYQGDNGWRLAAVARDVTSTFNAWNFTFTDEQKDRLTQLGQELPKNSLEVTLPRLILGAGKRFEFGSDYSFETELNANITTDGRRNTVINTDVVSIDPSLGIQFGYADAVFIRSGIGQVQKITNIDNEELWSMQPNIGVGVNLDKFAIDYAMANITQGAGINYSHVFSIRFKFNAAEDSSGSNTNGN
jgi:hypothetical protein